jgi:hypothetical protein
MAGAAALVVVLLHLLAWRRPPRALLPTARFAPDAPMRTVSRAVRPADLALLALRVLLLLLVGFALAGVRFVPKREGTARVIVVDRSLGAAISKASADSARAAFRAGDAVVLFDSVAREVSAPARDSIVPASEFAAPGLLSAGLVAAERAAERLGRAHDSVEVVIFSAFPAAGIDAATAGIRHLWPGRVRAVRAVRLPNDTAVARVPAIRATADDPVAAALALGGPVAGGSDVRVARETVTADDSAWARAGHTVVAWAASLGSAASSRSTPDTAFALTALGGGGATGASAATVVAPFQRLAIPLAGHVVARWSDGEPAAAEQALGDGCLRTVAVQVPGAGDLALTPAFRRFAVRMAEPCRATRPWAPASDSVLATVLSPTVPRDSLSRAAASVGDVPSNSALAPWLLGLAIVAAVGELLLRRERANATA